MRDAVIQVTIAAPDLGVWDRTFRIPLDAEPELMHQLLAAHFAACVGPAAKTIQRWCAPASAGAPAAKPDVPGQLTLPVPAPEPASTGTRKRRKTA